MIIALEYALRVLPRGMHDYRRFIAPAELAGFCRDAGLRIKALAGLHYDFFGRHFYLSPSDTRVNYFMHARREE
jgi:2-polyprenyl-6-hydroxyphenyl methylase/3-demethylubiquinone-9 3-methyltransferase